MIGKCLNGFYNSRNIIKIELVQDAVNKGIILKTAEIKKSNNIAKGTKKIFFFQEAKNTNGCLIRSFIFYYNNIY